MGADAADVGCVVSCSCISLCVRLWSAAQPCRGTGEAARGDAAGVEGRTRAHRSSPQGEEMNYLIHQDKLDELNAIIGNQGSPATSKVSDSFAALEVAIKTGTKEQAQKAFNDAVNANILVGQAWENAQEWH